MSYALDASKEMVPVQDGTVVVSSDREHVLLSVSSEAGRHMVRVSLTDHNVGELIDALTRGREMRRRREENGRVVQAMVLNAVGTDGPD